MAMDGHERRERLARARLYFVTESRVPGRPLEWLLGEALAGGVDVVQLRDKDAPDAAIERAAAVFRRACDEHGALFVLNDRADLAAACGADGVHVGQQDQAVAAARATAGGDLLVGLSTHAPAQFEAGLATGADYLCAGPVWETPTKPGRPATGTGYIRYAAEHAGERPWFAIGGIDAGNVREVVDAGARRIVVVRAIRDAADPRRAAEALLAEMRVGAAR
jgi:thiamine-phosphate pyrophosphorylase